MTELFNKICNFRRNNPGTPGNGININDPRLDQIKDDLINFKNYIGDNFINYRGFDFSIEISQGQGYFPNVLHLCILPPNQKVSSGIYTGICFDILGRGAVIGCMESVTHPMGLNTVIRKKKGIRPSIDVDGGRNTTKYNNSFGNPKEFFSGIQNDSLILDHIKDSIDIALYHLKLFDSENLNIATRIISNIEHYDFNPADMKDGRKKIARQIVSRRGQKKFRNAVMKAYNYQCAVTNDTVEQVLEAAHILPYKGDETNHIQNGILLRSDIHLLFDLGLLTINADDYLIKIHHSLLNSPYFIYDNKQIYIPSSKYEFPSKEALRNHNENSFSK